MGKLRTKNIAVFASGNGSNFRAIHSAVSEEKIPGKIVLLVSNNPKCGAAAYAGENNIQTEIINSRLYQDENQLVLAYLRVLTARLTDLIVLAGFMKKIPSEVVRSYKKRILNIHPALLPLFGGQGFYGKRVHEAVIASGSGNSGATVHFVDERYDHGPILVQATVPVLVNDDAEALAARVLRVEHRLYPEAVKAFCEDRIYWKNDNPLIRE